MKPNKMMNLNLFIYSFVNKVLELSHASIHISKKFHIRQVGIPLYYKQNVVYNPQGLTHIYSFYDDIQG